jgi:hypothetical protein
MRLDGRRLSSLDNQVLEEEMDIEMVHKALEHITQAIQRGVEVRQFLFSQGKLSEAYELDRDIRKMKAAHEELYKRYLEGVS